MDHMKHNMTDDSMMESTAECKSWVASRFTLVEDCGVYKRRCRYINCNKEYSRGTSHMILKRHWSKAHADIFSLSPRSRAAVGVGTVQSTTRPPPIRSSKKKSPLKASNVHTTVSSPAGTKRERGGSQNTSSNKVVGNDKLQQFDVKLVAKRLREATSIHLTLDIYTPKKGGKTFGIITAYSISDSNDIKSVLLEYRHLPYPDDSNSIYEFLKSCITKFNCREKIISIATNGSGVVTSAVQEFDKRYRLAKNYNFSTIHIKCFPQFIHLNVIDVLRSQEPLLNGIRKVIAFINNNNFTMRPIEQSNDSNPSDGTSAMQDAESAPNDELDPDSRSTGLKLPLDNKTNWNSTYNMIDTFFQQRGFIEQALMYFQNTQELNNVAIDWDRLYALVQLLEPFYEVIGKFAKENFVPVSVVGAVIPILMNRLSEASNWAYNDLAMAAHQFRIQLDTYRQNFECDLTIIAGLLDPRIMDHFVPQDNLAEVHDLLKKRMGEQVPSEEKWLFADIFVKRNPDELRAYFERSRELEKCNVFAFWECYKNVFPTLYNLARVVACVQATSVPGDRMFSAAENAERERKAQLESTNSKELMRSWARYLEK